MSPHERISKVFLRMGPSSVHGETEAVLYTCFVVVFCMLPLCTGMSLRQNRRGDCGNRMKEVGVQAGGMHVLSSVQPLDHRTRTWESLGAFGQQRNNDPRAICRPPLHRPNYIWWFDCPFIFLHGSSKSNGFRPRGREKTPLLRSEGEVGIQHRCVGSSGRVRRATLTTGHALYWGRRCYQLVGQRRWPKSQSPTHPGNYSKKHSGLSERDHPTIQP